MGALACGQRDPALDTPEAHQEKLVNKQIDEKLKEEKKSTDLDLKLLLLGTGDSGKSTFTKQMSFIYGDKYNNAQFANIFQVVLRDNCLDGMKQLIEIFSATEEIELTDSHRYILSAPELTPEVAKHIIQIWENPRAKQILAESLSESFRGGISGAKYYLDNTARFVAPDYVPTKEDILLARRKSVGIVETQFFYNKSTITLVDVGGQRSERKKWFHCFSAVTAVIFLTAINEYDMVLEEDVKTNRLLESLTLWHALTCAPHFKTTPFILFLNKSDLFKEKIETGPLSDVFLDFNEVTSAPEFEALTMYEKSWHYILRQFKSRFGGYKFFHHLTNCLDTKLCQKIFENINSVIVELALSKVGL